MAITAHVASKIKTAKVTESPKSRSELNIEIPNLPLSCQFGLRWLGVFSLLGSSWRELNSPCRSGPSSTELLQEMTLKDLRGGT